MTGIFIYNATLLQRSCNVDIANVIPFHLSFETKSLCNINKVRTIEVQEQGQVRTDEMTMAIVMICLCVIDAGPLLHYKSFHLYIIKARQSYKRHLCKMARSTKVIFLAGGMGSNKIFCTKLQIVTLDLERECFNGRMNL